MRGTLKKRKKTIAKINVKKYAKKELKKELKNRLKIT